MCQVWRSLIFLGAPVVKADFRYGIHDLFAVQFQQDAKDAVCAGMLGAQVQIHYVGVFSALLQAPFFRVKSQGLLFPFLPLGR